MTAPYVIRDEQTFWHRYDLPVAWEDQPVGILLVVYLQPGERLDCQTILDALQPALKPAPVGEWWKITVPERNIRSKPVVGNIIFTVGINDRVQVAEKVLLNTWGRITSYRRGTVTTPLEGYIYLASLIKE